MHPYVNSLPQRCAWYAPPAIFTTFRLELQDTPPDEDSCRNEAMKVVIVVLLVLFPVFFDSLLLAAVKCGLWPGAASGSSFRTGWLAASSIQLGVHRLAGPATACRTRLSPLLKKISPHLASCFFLRGFARYSPFVTERQTARREQRLRRLLARRRNERLPPPRDAIECSRLCCRPVLISSPPGACQNVLLLASLRSGASLDTYSSHLNSGR